MIRRQLCSFLVAVLFLSACAAPAPARKLQTVPPGKLFEGGYINIKAPRSEGWMLTASSNSGMTFGKGDATINETFIAQVVAFDLEPAETPEKFEALVKAGIANDTDPNRFTIQNATYTYTSERGYPCVRYHSVVEDKAPRRLPGTKGPLLLESEALYCRHPVRQGTGFAVSYSHRGESLYPNLVGDALEFIEGVQVPAK